MAKWTLRILTLGYVAMLLLVPLGMIAYRTFENGIAPVWDALSSPYAVHALYLSVLVTVIVVPINPTTITR